MELSYEEKVEAGSTDPWPINGFILKGGWYNYIDSIFLVKVEEYNFTVAQLLWQERWDLKWLGIAVPINSELFYSLKNKNKSSYAEVACSFSLADRGRS